MVAFTALVLTIATSCTDSPANLFEPGPLPPAGPQPSPPGQPDPLPAPSRRILVQSVSQMYAPYSFSAPIEIHGENLDLATYVWFTGYSPPVGILEQSATRLRVQTPVVGRWMRTGLWVSARDPAASARDTLAGFDFVGPLTGDTLVYEFRNASVDTLYQVLRWPDNKMPLKIYIPIEWPRDAQAVIRRGIQAWENVAGPRIPTFGYVQTPAAADIVWRVQEFPNCGGAHPEWEPGSGEMQRAFTTLCNTAFFPDEGNNHANLLNLAVHEMGHMLGIWRHSPHESDVMGGGNFSETGLSRGDSLTLRRLYELQPGFQPQPR